MEIISSLKSWWHGLVTREQKILRIGGALMGLLLFYWLIVDPVYTGRDRAEQDLLAAREAFALMKQQSSEIKASSARGGPSPFSGSLLTLIESSAQQQGLRDGLKSLQPTGNNQVQVTLEGASYQQLMQWLINLHQKGVVTQRADVRSDRKDKLLRAQLLLGR